MEEIREIREFLIELENNKDVYLPGDIVAGNLVLELWSPMQVKELKLTFSGEAKIHYWNTTEPFRCGYERYFEQSVVILECDKEIKDGHEVEEGVHKYPFIFELPSKLPTSFEDGFAHVSYITTAILFTNMLYSQKTCTRLITVLSHLDLNEIDYIDVPCEEQMAKNLCCLCCTTGPVTGILRLDRTGYIPGETIHVNVEFTNMSRYTCNICVVGTQTVSYTQLSKKDTEHWFCQAVRREVHPGDSETLSEKLIIQPIPPSSGLTGCGIISIDYHVQLKVMPVAFRTPPFYIKQRIVIGTVPLKSVVEQYTMEYPGALSTTPTANEFQLTFKESKYGPKYHYFDCLKDKA
ncbi:arrestin domain-containing protein 3-like isoform X1 [Mytilus edulis]|uniref:arrestin domain-containing protein 3-like isoform X1 n=1 Tax=Mytilus edulis TaxID=6550 RepID=UPI0039EE57B3